jgi:hypothetical protein
MVCIHRQQGTGDAMAHCACLATWTAASDGDLSVKFIRRACDGQGLGRRDPKRFQREIVLERPAIHHDFAGSTGQSHSRDRGLPPSSADLSFCFLEFDVRHWLKKVE